MSGGISATTVLAAAAVAGTAYSIYNGQQQASAQRSAQDLARKTAAAQEKAGDEATNRANQKSADTTGALSAAMQAGKSGASGTMLTGAQGIDPGALNLGKSTLLGM